MNIKKLNTKRLLSLYKSRRKALFSSQNLESYFINASKYDVFKKEMEELSNEVDSIKKELNSREHVEKKK